MDTTFTGQKSDDSTGLMFYGARYYDSALGRFTQADTIVPGALNPQSLNRYAYVQNNPANRIDPDGHTDCQSWDTWCWENQHYTAQGLCYSQRTDDWTRTCKPEADNAEIVEEVYHVNLEGDWQGRELDILLNALYKVSSTLLGGFYSAFGGTTFFLEEQAANIMGRIGHACLLQGTIPGCAPGVHVYQSLFAGSDNSAIYAIIHEMGHQWDSRSGGFLSRGMANSAGTISNWVGLGVLPPGAFTNPYATQFGNLPFIEDWAESFAAFVYPEYFAEVGWRGLGRQRSEFIALQVQYWINQGEDPYSNAVIGGQ